MSSLWTPSGEHPVQDDRPTAGGGAAPPPGRGPAEPPSPPPPAAGQSPGDPAGAIDELRRELAQTPADVVVANHAFGIFELAAIYLSQEPPMLEEARLAIDAMGALVDTLGPRLGEAHDQLKDGLAQLRIAFVQLAAATQARTAEGNGDGAAP